ncbi:MAG: nucleoside monophosphate kinase [Holosporaceae bacterium]|jgi:adenylate kinase|nr:nucleoside monophosphate kinase [Holosporaceae bacterium]
MIHRNVTLIILVGAPGSGKGTLAQYLKEKFDICYFSTGVLLRNEVKKGTDIGRSVERIVESGGLVEDSLVNEIVRKNIKDIEPEGKAVILDGYPRTKEQAQFLDEIDNGALKQTIKVIELVVDNEEVIVRISKRRVCAKCGNTYGPMDKIDICSCGGKLIKRKDDEELTVRNRLDEYEKATLPLIDYYSDRIVKISGKRTPEENARVADNYLCDWGIERRR